MTVNKNYYDDLSKFEGLSNQELTELFDKYRQGDSKAYNKLIESNLKLVIHFAKKYWVVIKDIRVFEYDDLVSEGNLGLITAITKYQPNKKIKFAYYASFWIKKSIIDFIKRHTEIKIDENANYELIDYPDEMYDMDEINSKLVHLLNELTDKEQFIMKMLFGLGQDKNYKINEIAQIMEIKRQYVYQLKMAAFKKLKKKLNDEI